MSDKQGEQVLTCDTSHWSFHQLQQTNQKLMIKNPQKKMNQMERERLVKLRQKPKATILTINTLKP